MKPKTPTLVVLDNKRLLFAVAGTGVNDPAMGPHDRPNQQLHYSSSARARSTRSSSTNGLVMISIPGARNPDGLAAPSA